jgi:hypothetical protein
LKHARCPSKGDSRVTRVPSRRHPLLLTSLRHRLQRVLGKPAWPVREGGGEDLLLFVLRRVF